MKRFYPPVLALLVVYAAGCGDSPTSPEHRTPPELSAAALLQHVNVLAADGMRGRRAGSQFERDAAEYVAGRFARMGLQPGTDDFYQEFTITQSVDGRRDLPSQNVVAVLPGQGALAGEWVVLGAHYDHLGVESTPSGTVVFNGADDNASGTSLLIEVARVLSELVNDGLIGEDGRRSVMFHAYGAEEVGLVGSFYFCDNPTVPMNTIVAMLNFDMVGRLREDQLMVFGSYSSRSWPERVDAANTLNMSITLAEDLVGRSDQFCFLLNGRPALFLHTGLHAQYHTPEDDAALINEEGMARVGQFALALAVELLTRTEVPEGGGLRPEGIVDPVEVSAPETVGTTEQVW